MATSSMVEVSPPWTYVTTLMVPLMSVTALCLISSVSVA